MAEKPACWSNVRYWKNCSCKDCVCGRHNQHNRKANRHHHSTRSRLKIKLQRRSKRKRICEEQQDGPAD